MPHCEAFPGRVSELGHAVQILHRPFGQFFAVRLIDLRIPGKGEPARDIEPESVPLEGAEIGIAPVADDISSGAFHPVGVIGHGGGGKVAVNEFQTVPDVIIFKFPVDAPVPVQDLDILCDFCDGGISRIQFLAVGLYPFRTADGVPVFEMAVQQFFAPQQRGNTFGAEVIGDLTDIVRINIRRTFFFCILRRVRWCNIRRVRC